MSSKYLAEFLAQNGHEVYVITRGKNEKRNISRTQGITVFHSLSDPKIPPRPGVRTVLNWAANIPQLTRMIEFLKPDIVHSYSIDMLSRIRIALGERPTPSVATLNNHFITCPFLHLNPRDEICIHCDPQGLMECFGAGRIPVLAPLEKLLQLLRFSFSQGYDHFTVLSEAHRRILVCNGFTPSRISVIPNFLDPMDFRARARRYKGSLALKLNIGRGDEVVSYVGHLRAQKGVDYLIQAVPRVLESHPETRFLIVGPGPERLDLIRLADSMGVARNIRFIPYIENERIPGLYALSTIFAFPSIWSEPFGRVIIEAMAVGTAVVATSVGGVPEIIDHERNGVLVPPRDPEALADSITSLLEDRKKRIRIGDQGKRTVESRFTPRVVGPRVLEIYKSLLSSTRRS